MKEREHTQLELVSLDSEMDSIAANKPNISGFQISRVKHILHEILSHKENDEPGAWSVLNMDILRKKIHNASLYMKYLDDLEIIERTGYKKGEYSRSYRIRKEGYTEERPVTDQKLIRKIEASYKEISRHNSKM